MSKFISALAIIVAAAGWNQFLLRPLAYYYHGHSLAETSRQLLLASNDIYPGDLMLGWLFILTTFIVVPLLCILTASVLRAIIRYIERSEISFTVLETRVHVEMLTEDKSRGRVSRVQKFHANKKDVGAYRFSHSSDTGQVRRGNLDVNTQIDGRSFTKKVHRADKGQTVEIIEVYDRPLPTNLLTTYLPDNVVLALYEGTSILDSVVAERTVRTLIDDEYDAPTPMYQITIARNPLRNIHVDMDFFASACPTRDRIRAMLFSDNAVSYLEPTFSDRQNRVVCSFYVKRLLQGETLRIEWEN